LSWPAISSTSTRASSSGIRGPIFWVCTPHPTPPAPPAARSVDAFALRRRFAWLAALVDAEYGSATFIGAAHPAAYEVRVSTTGLLVREVDPPE
jgi:hypothetical protein